MNCPAKLLVLSGELALPKLRVARVSRLIGNSDSTAKGYGWQEEGGEEERGKPKRNWEWRSPGLGCCAVSSRPYGARALTG
jgi:hypothetical protein